jgi:hypothetical protein
MNPTAIYSKSGKGVQEAAGKTSLLPRPDRAVLSAIDGRATLADVAQKVGKTFDAAFQTLVAQLDKNGFIREVSPGAGGAAPRPAAAAPKPAATAPRPAGAAAPAKPAARPAKPEDSGADLDFSSLGTPSRPAAPPPQQNALTKAREDAEAKAQADRERLKKEVEAKTRAEMEAKLRADAEKKQKEDAAAADAKIKAARDAALKAAAEAKLKVEQEAKAKLEAERKAREDAERKAKEEAERVRKETEEKARREAEELRKSLEAERKAREEAERKAKEEAERLRKELEEERKRLEAERKREDEERAARRKREDEEEQARRKEKEEEERKVEEERGAKRRQREEEEAAREKEEEDKRAAKKRQREAEDAVREAHEEAQREAARAAKKKLRDEEDLLAAAAGAVTKAATKAPSKPEPPKAEAKKDSFADSLLADLDNFTNKDEEEAKQRDEDERKAKAETSRQAREAAEHRAKEEAEERRREEEEARRKEEDARRAREEEERHAQEEERRKREAEEIRRKAEAATAAAMAKEGKTVAPRAADEDIPVSDDDLDMDEVQKEQAALDKAGKAKEKPEKAEKEKKKKKPVEVEALPRIRRPGKWGKPIAYTLALLLVIALGVAHFVPLDTEDYERVATEALGQPVKIGSAKLWLPTGLQLRFADVRVGDARIAHVTGHPSVGSLFGDKKEFATIEIDSFSLPQEAMGDALFASVKSDGFTVERIVVKDLRLPGPATLPKSLQADVVLDAKGALKTATLRGPDGLVAKITPREGGVSFELTAAGFTLPIAPQVTLSNFGMSGNATPRGMNIAQWGGSLLGGAMSGTANVRWGSNWAVDGVVTVRNINAAVFAPALLSSGNAEGTGRFSMSAPDPGGLVSAGRIDGNFTVNKGTLGSFDLARAIQSGGRQYAGSTQFVEMNGQGSYDRGAVALRNITIAAGALNAGASADISQSGALSGRIVADVKTTTRALSATLLLGGTVKEPQVRN